MPTGIIISTQTPSEGQTFPRRGATGHAVAQATGFPLIRMHRNKKPVEEELCPLKAIGHNSHVIITGHGNTELPFLSGGVLSCSMEEVESFDFELEAYRDLIIKNSTLNPQDTLHITLWTCYGGDGGNNSSARQLAALFADKGIDTVITCSMKAIKRFNGRYEPDEEETTKIKYRVRSNTDIRVIRTRDGKVQEYETSQAVYAHRDTGILHNEENLSLIDSQPHQEALYSATSQATEITATSQDETSALIDALDACDQILVQSKSYGARELLNGIVHVGPSLMEQQQAIKALKKIIVGEMEEGLTAAQQKALTFPLSKLHLSMKAFFRENTLSIKGKSCSCIDDLVHAAGNVPSEFGNA